MHDVMYLDWSTQKTRTKKAKNVNALPAIDDKVWDGLGAKVMEFSKRLVWDIVRRHKMLVASLAWVVFLQVQVSICSSRSGH